MILSSPWRVYLARGEAIGFSTRGHGPQADGMFFGGALGSKLAPRLIFPLLPVGPHRVFGQRMAFMPCWGEKDGPVFIPSAYFEIGTVCVGL